MWFSISFLPPTLQRRKNHKSRRASVRLCYLIGVRDLSSRTVPDEKGCVTLVDRWCRFFFLAGGGQSGPIAASAMQSIDGDLPSSYYAVCRLQSGTTSCSGTIVADLGSGRYLVTTARHCFGTSLRNGIKVTYWRAESAGDSLARRGLAPLFERSSRQGIAAGTGTYHPAAGVGDFGTVIANLDAPRGVVVVGNCDLRQLRDRKVYAVGSAGGAWPPIRRSASCFNTGTDSRGNIVYADAPIASGQSGGALFDAETGWLIAVTNWGGPRGTEALHVSTWLSALRKNLPQ